MVRPVKEHGFHAFAYGEKFVNNEPALLGNVSLLRNFTGSKARKVISEVDVRKERHKMIQGYLNDLRKHGYNQEK